MKETLIDLHRERMKGLVEFTASSFSTEFPSPFGSSIYDSTSGVCVSRSYDTVIQMCDPINHAEVNAIRIATQKLNRLSLRGYVLYSTCEPCPMCMSACIWAELDLVVFGASTLEDANVYWPQASDMSPQELVARIKFDSKVELLGNFERELCKDLFKRCDDIRKEGNLCLPPNRNT